MDGMKRKQKLLVMVILMLILGIIVVMTEVPRERKANIPIIEVKVNDMKVLPDTLIKVDEAEKILIKGIHPEGISKIYYRIGKGQLQSATENPVSIAVNKEKGIYSINIYVVSKNNIASSWEKYLFKIR